MTEAAQCVLLHYTLISFCQLKLPGSLEQLDLKSLN